MQCEHIGAYGQCPKDVITGRFCEKHSPASRKTVVNQYRIACDQLGDGPARHANAEQLKSISSEIIIIRSVLESRINMIQSDAEMVAAMPVIKDYILAVEKLVTSCHTMDVKIGNVLSKTSLLTLAREIIHIIEDGVRPLVDTTPSQHTVDELIEAIGTQLVQAIAAQENPPT